MADLTQARLYVGGDDHADSTGLKRQRVEGQQVLTPAYHFKF